MFSHLYHNQRERFDELFFGEVKDKKGLHEFWMELQRREDPRLMGHEVRKRHQWGRKALPISLHGDGVPVLQVGRSQTKSFDSFSIQSILSVGPSAAVKLFVFGVFDKLPTDGTWENIWEIVNWSLHWLWEGVWPPVDWRGEPWGASHPSENDSGKLVCLSPKDCSGRSMRSRAT